MEQISIVDTNAKKTKRYREMDEILATMKTELTTAGTKTFIEYGDGTS